MGAMRRVSGEGRSSRLMGARRPDRTVSRLLRRIPFVHCFENTEALRAATGAAARSDLCGELLSNESAGHQWNLICHAIPYLHRGSSQ